MDKLKVTIPLSCPLYYKVIDWCLILFYIISVIMIGWAIVFINFVAVGLIIDSITHYDVRERLIMILFTIVAIFVDSSCVYTIFEFVQFDCIKETGRENKYGK